jgi:ribonuclease P protein component
LGFNCNFADKLSPFYLNLMDFNYPKEEKLKSKITIGLLFSEGKSVSKYPLRLVYCPLNNNEQQPIKMGVSVSKKYFKKAVDRNYFKRVLRETYRLNKHLLLDALEEPYGFMFFYQTKERLTYEEINTKTIQLFEKFVAQLAQKKVTQSTDSPCTDISQK